MTLEIRDAASADASAMVEVLNTIISAGGTTAHQTPFDDKKMLNHYIAGPNVISCQVAAVDGKVKGFQYLGRPHNAESLPKNWGIIASFVDQSSAGLGIGSKLFEQTIMQAKRAGVVAIDATIRADNDSGLRYYSRMGFIDYDRLTAVPLSDGTKVDRVRKRFDLARS